ncbi:MAG TPA: ATP-binding protein [Thermoanaerobaculia bacterium]|nr:ATP-binding protein [Thermoanaerobaculia bacterium]
MASDPERERRPLDFETRILLLSFATGLPGSLVSLALLWGGDYSPKIRWTFSVLVLVFWWGFAAALKSRVIRALQMLSNLLGALREGDFSLRARRPRENDALAEVMREVNALGEVLLEQRLGAVEATALLHRVMEEVDVAIFAFDDSARLQVVNRAGERLLAESAERLLGQTAEELGVADCLTGEVARTLERTFPGGPGRWEVRRSAFREEGLPHQLLVISDLSQTLREEERQAWRRLLRVLGHELNNSLAPIRSMAGTLLHLLDREPPPPDWRDDMRQGLAVIGDRSESLIRFMAAYAKLARLPPPRRIALELSELIRRAVALETRLAVRLAPGPPVALEGDPDQIEQALINLIRNAADAALETGGGVEVAWWVSDGHVAVGVDDEGPGLANTENLFVPFYTTKPGGSGIGLALSRQIAEAHGGTLTLENRRLGIGCEARLRLPLPLA